MDSIFLFRNFHINKNFKCSILIYIQDYRQEKKVTENNELSSCSCLQASEKFQPLSSLSQFQKGRSQDKYIFLIQVHNGLSFLVDDQPVSSNLKKAYYGFRRKAFRFARKTFFLRFVFLGLFVTNFFFIFLLFFLKSNANK